MLLHANPYITKNSLFTDILPITSPESIEGVSRLTLFFFIIEIVIAVVITLLFINLILYFCGVNTLKLYGNLKLKTRRVRLFGKNVGDSELVIVLLNTLEVLRDQTEFANRDTMSSLNDVVYKVETVLTILEKQDKDTREDMFNFLDKALSYEKYLMTKLVNYLDNNNRIKERIVEESLLSINDGFDRVLEEYVNNTAKSVEDELFIYNELREKQKESDYEDLIRRD